MLKRFLLLLGLLTLPSLASAQVDFFAKTYDLVTTSYTYCTEAAGATDPTCGTTSADGWVRTVAGTPIVIQVNWITKAATSLEYQIECKISNDTDTSPSILSTISMTAIGIQTSTIWPQGYLACRVGLKLTTDAGVNSVSAWMGQGIYR
jgi:hypothetical protein